MSLSIAVLISGNGSNLQAIIESIKKTSLDVNIAVVISDKKDAYGLVRAHAANITTAFVDPALYNSREQFDNKVSNLIERHHVSLIVLAGFMRILSNNFVVKYLGKIINIHPSLLPKYKGLNTHQRVLDAKDIEHGATVHFVTAELDEGPIIMQSRFNVNLDDTFISLKQKTHILEHQIYSESINLFVKNRIELKNKQIYLDGIISNQNVRIKKQIKHL